MDLGEELAALRALDHAVVVGARERDHLAHAEARDRLYVGALEFGRVVDGADADDQALARHQSGYGMLGSDDARVGDRHGRRREVVGGDLPVAHSSQQLFVGAVELREVERVRGLHVGHEQCARAVGFCEVDRDAEVDVLVAHDRRVTVGDAVAGVHRGHLVERTKHREADDVGERHLAATGAGQMVVEDLPVDLEQLGRDRAHRRGRRHREALLHVLDDARRGAPQHRRALAFEQQRGRSRLRGRLRCRLRWRRGRRGLRRAVARDDRDGPGGGLAWHVVGEELAPRVGERLGVLDVLAVHVFDHPGVRAEIADRPPRLAPLAHVFLLRSLIASRARRRGRRGRGPGGR